MKSDKNVRPVRVGNQSWIKQSDGSSYVRFAEETSDEFTKGEPVEVLTTEEFKQLKAKVTRIERKAKALAKK